MLYIIVLATDIYNIYLEYLEKSLVNITIPYKLIVISDKLPKVKYDFYYHIANLPYPFVAYHKLDYIEDCINIYNLNGENNFIYVDADSVFRKMTNNFYNYFNDLCNQNVIWFPRSPWCFDKDTIPNENNCNINNECYINNLDKYNYIQSSMFFGKIKLFHELYKYCYEYTTLMTKNHRNQPVIPYLYEQSIINRIMYDHPEKYKVDDFIFNAYDIDIMNDSDFVNKDYSEFNYKCAGYRLNHYPNIFLLQKFNVQNKLSKRL